MTANKPMTGEQLDELMTIAVNTQRDTEKVSDRPAAMFAYAVQVAVLELRKVRNEAAALRDEMEAAEKRISELESDNAYIRNRHKELDLLIGKNILVMQAAIIEWQGTGDAKRGWHGFTTRCLVG